MKCVVTVRRGRRWADIICHTHDLSARHQFHNGKRQKKDDRWIDPDLLGGIESQAFEGSCRTFRKEKLDARPEDATRKATTSSSSKKVRRAVMASQGAVSEDELSRFEREHPEGVSSEKIVEFFTKRGIRFSEATLRKYVQKGVLPRSRRVAREGSRRGSQGLYPGNVVRRIQSLKALLSTYTMQEIQSGLLFVRTDVEVLERTLESIFLSLSAAARSSRAEHGSPQRVTRELSLARALATKLVAKITSAESRLTMQARLRRRAA